MNKIYSRKFIVVVMSILCTAALMYLGKISDGVYSAVVMASVAAYIAGNVVQKQTEIREGG